ncbi:MAG: MBOAT family protein [Myxococcales bacterium]|nr:MBOAT family protein [Myxococcales bacterium]
MTFATTPFLIFFVAVFVVYWLFRKQRVVRTLALIAASYIFYASTNPWFLILLVYISVFDYFMSHKVAATEQPGRRKLYLVISLVSSVSLLALFKYLDFFFSIPADVAEKFDVFWQRKTFGLPLPLGISFFVFQTISYMVDVYRRKIEPSTSLLDYLLYIAFFPRMVLGPIVRANFFLPQLAETPRLSRERLSQAIFLLIIGFLKKLVIAEYVRLNLVDRVFDLPLFFSATEVLAAIYGSMLQLYCDFSGYMDIVIGLSLLLGLQLPENFNFPFKSRSIREFWNRWHITFSTWLRDYLYIPMGGSRVSHPWKVYRNLMLTFLIGGLWHGAAWTYILWGFTFGVGVCWNRFFQGRRILSGRQPGESRFLFYLDVFTTFQYLGLTWIMYKSSSIQTVIDVLGRLLPWLALSPNYIAFKEIQTVLTGGELLPLIRDGIDYFRTAILGVTNLTPMYVGVMLLGFAGMWLPDKWYEKMRGTFLRLPLVVQLLIAVLALGVIYKVTSFSVAPFEYQRF